MADENPGAGRSVVPLWKQRRFVIGAVIVLLVVLAGVGIVLAGGGDDEEPAPATTSTEPASTTTVEPGTPAPLTGLLTTDPAVFSRPALSVKIDNQMKSVRPDQAGLDVADVVYVEPVEGVTRFVAVFHSQAPLRVGPVRSTRFIDPGIVWPLGHAPYVYSGGTPPKVDAIRSSPAQTFDETALVGIDARVRDSSIPRPHNLFAIPEAVWAAADEKSPPAPLFTYLAEGDAFTGAPASVVEIPTLSRDRYTWDPTAGGWRREQQCRPGHCDATDREPHLAESGDQITPTNLVIQRIAGTERESVVGEGEAWVLSQGQVVHGRWVRPTLDDVTGYVDEAGAAISLTPGTTWVHLITGGEVTITP